MTNIHEKSLKLITELLDSMSAEEFLATYKSVERNIGPTVTEYIESHPIKEETYEKINTRIIVICINCNC